MDLSNYKKEFKVVGKKAEKTRWDACEELATLVGRRTIQISTLFKGMDRNIIEGFTNVAKTYSRPDISFWSIWKEHKPK